MVYRCNFNFGEDSNGSVIALIASNITAKQVPGTVKQLIGKRLVKRNVLARNIYDWDMAISGVYQGTTDEIETFKDNIYNLQGVKQSYTDGVSSHTGSYLIDNNGFQVDEEPEKYKNGYITYTLNLIQWNQE